MTCKKCLEWELITGCKNPLEAKKQISEISKALENIKNNLRLN